MLTGELHGIARHVRVDTILLARIVATNTRQAFTRRGCATGLLSKKFGIPSRPLRLVKVTDGKVLCRINPGIAGSCLGLHRNETNPKTIGQRIEGKAGRTLGQTHPGAIVGIPVGEILALVAGARPGVGADRHTAPRTAPASRG